MAKSKKKILGLIKLQIPAGKANPSPPVGPALGQKGLNIMEFCKAFNAATQKMKKGNWIKIIFDPAKSINTRNPKNAPLASALQKTTNSPPTTTRTCPMPSTASSEA